MRSKYCTEPPSVVYDSTTNGSAGNRQLAREHPPEEREGAVLVQELVQVAALGGLDAGRAAVGARAPGEQALGVRHPALDLVVAAARDADAARVAVVDEHRRPARLEVQVRREAADVPAVAHGPERQERDHGVLGRL